MKKTTTARSPKKEDGLMISAQILNKIEYHAKDQALELKIWNDTLAILDLNIRKFDTIAKRTVNMPSNELSKEFVESQTKLAKIKKEMESTQKALNKLQGEFEKKLVIPNQSGHYGTLSQDIVKSLQENIKKTQEAFDANKKLLNEVIEKSLECTRKLVLLEDPINKLCIPDKVEEAVDLNEKLNKRLIALCEGTAALPQTENPAPCDPNLAKSFLQLYTAHREGDKLLAQIKKNIKDESQFPSLENLSLNK